MSFGLILDLVIFENGRIKTFKLEDLLKMEMIVIPAVDIRRGKCVQLVHGRPGTDKYYGDPVETAKRWEEEGARTLHIVDIDAALGDGENFGVVRQIAKEVSIPIQFGGGIRDQAYAKRALDYGVERVIFGSAAIEDPNVVTKTVQEYGKERVMVALDSANGMVVVRGWRKKTERKAVDVIRRFEKGVFGFLVTDVDREGEMAGVDIGEFEGIVRSTDARICASGGISSPRDIKALRDIGVWGCVVGKALYEGRISPLQLRNP